MSQQSIITEIINERTRQDAKYGGAEHDDDHIPREWQMFIRSRVEQLDTADYRKHLIQIAALAVAAIESCDRNNETETK